MVFGCILFAAISKSLLLKQTISILKWHDSTQGVKIFKESYEMTPQNWTGLTQS